jgi:hypothetical protein
MPFVLYASGFISPIFHPFDHTLRSIHLFYEAMATITGAMTSPWRLTPFILGPKLGFHMIESMTSWR